MDLLDNSSIYTSDRDSAYTLLSCETGGYLKNGMLRRLPGTKKVGHLQTQSLPANGIQVRKCYQFVISQISSSFLPHFRNLSKFVLDIEVGR